jgi:hypothetical protein
MKDINSHINDLRRPKLLVRAARHGIDTYNRTVHLARFIDLHPLPGPGVALMKLFDSEREMNEARLAKSSTYVPSQHISILTAIMAETHLMRASTQPRLVFSAL